MAEQCAFLMNSSVIFFLGYLPWNTQGKHAHSSSGLTLQLCLSNASHTDYMPIAHLMPFKSQQHASFHTDQVPVIYRMPAVSFSLRHAVTLAEENGFLDQFLLFLLIGNLI